MWNLKHNTNELIYETETDSHLIFPVTQRWSWKGHWNLTLQDLILVCALTEMCDVTKWEFEPGNISPTYLGQLSFGHAPWNLPIQKATHRDLDNLWPQSISKWRQSKLSRQMRKISPKRHVGREGSEVPPHLWVKTYYLLFRFSHEPPSSSFFPTLISSGRNSASAMKGRAGIIKYIFGSSQVDMSSPTSFFFSLLCPPFLHQLDSGRLLFVWCPLLPSTRT